MGRPRATKSQALSPTSDDEDAPPQRSTRAPRRVKKPTASRRKPPAIIASSEDDDGVDTHAPSSPDAAPAREFSPAETVSTSNPKSNPKSPTKTKGAPKARKAAEAVPKEKATKTLYSFFNTATQRQQSHGASESPSKRNVSPARAETQEEEDLIQDDSLDEDTAKHADVSATFAVPFRKRKLEPHASSSSGLIQGSQKFLKNVGGRSPMPDSQRERDAVEHRDTRPWVDRYAPTSLADLAVHKKKVSDVGDWLRGVLSGRDRKRLLILRGGAGAGKTMTVKLLAQELGVSSREWHNPSSAEYSSEGYVSTSAQFDEFIGSGAHYGTLDVVTPGQATLTSHPVRDEDAGRRVTIVEEFPTAFTRSSPSLQAFRSCLARYLAANTPSMDALFSRQHERPTAAPIIMIITETMLGGSSSSMDSFTAHRLLGPEILAHPGVTVIDFNPVAPTILTKALELVIRKEARDSGRRRAPGPAVLKHLSEIGDVRSAVATLEFLCLRGDDPNAQSGRVAATAQKGRKGAPSKAVTLSETGKKSLEFITQRENALGIFHAVGKVVYNKRQVPATKAPALPQPPPYLAQHARPNVPENDVDTLMDELGTDVRTFVAALHENYVLSCTDPDSGMASDSMNGSIDALCDADLLCSDDLGAGGLFRRAFRGAGTDTMRQEELSFQVAVRGLLFHLPSPVRRAAPPAKLARPNQRGARGAVAIGGVGDASKMFYPTSLKLWRQREEIEGMVDVLLDKAQRGELNVDSKPASSGSGAKAFGVDSFKRNGGGGKFPLSPLAKPSARNPPNSGDCEESAPLLRTGGTAAKAEFLLERLPYIELILKYASASNRSADLLRQIDSVTRMTGTADADAADSEGEDEGTESVAPGPQTTLGHGTKTGGRVFMGAQTADEQALVLSDDDIEDD